MRTEATARTFRGYLKHSKRQIILVSGAAIDLLHSSFTLLTSFIVCDVYCTCDASICVHAFNMIQQQPISKRATPNQTPNQSTYMYLTCLPDRLTEKER